MGVGRGEQGGKLPWISKLLAKILFFQFRGVKTKFHHFWSPWKKFWENPLLAPLEKILPTPVILVSAVFHDATFTTRTSRFVARF